MYQNILHYFVAFVTPSLSSFKTCALISIEVETFPNSHKTLQTERIATPLFLCMLSKRVLGLPQNISRHQILNKKEMSLPQRKEVEGRCASESDKNRIFRIKGGRISQDQLVSPVLGLVCKSCLDRLVVVCSQSMSFDHLTLVF